MWLQMSETVCVCALVPVLVRVRRRKPDLDFKVIKHSTYPISRHIEGMQTYSSQRAEQGAVGDESVGSSA